MISEEAEDTRRNSGSTLADLLLRTVGADPEGFAEVIARQTWAEDERPLGEEFAE